MSELPLIARVEEEGVTHRLAGGSRQCTIKFDDKMRILCCKTHPEQPSVALQSICNRSRALYLGSEGLDFDLVMVLVATGHILGGIEQYFANCGRTSDPFDFESLASCSATSNLYTYKFSWRSEV